MNDEAHVNVLFVCSKNQWRSPTAEHLFATDPSLSVRSAGTSRSARRRVTAADLRWADLCIVMEHHHRDRIRELFPREHRATTTVVADVPDEYQYMDPELVELVEAAIPPLLDRYR